ncbi:MAG: hypothetical protein WC783_00185 [Candidatus Paceibacterota bacterium]|jgi:hypothetical protein
MNYKKTLKKLDKLEKQVAFNKTNGCPKGITYSKDNEECFDCDYDYHDTCTKVCVVPNKRRASLCKDCPVSIEAALKKYPCSNFKQK